jgi:2-keto-3-deoxy-L-fuconate dehydrogenase
MPRLNNKTALITGAAQGIGRATALKFIEEGAHVIACDINQQALEQLRAECGCEIRVLDLHDAQAIHQLTGTISSLDILFNCAGFVHSGTIEDCDEEAWDFSMDLNVKAMYRMIRALLPLLKQSGAASIINMSSVASSIIGVSNRFVYGVSKAAVIGLTKAVALDFVQQGVRCNAICPGTVQTPSLDERLRATGDYEKAHGEFVARQPMGRLGQAQEIAALALYLASDESAYTTGTTQVIDGAWTVA